MYEDSWYSFVPDVPAGQENITGHQLKQKRRQSLLQQPSVWPSQLFQTAQLTTKQERNHVNSIQTGPPIGLFKDTPVVSEPPEATLIRRAKSYSDFYFVARSQLKKHARRAREVEKCGDLAIEKTEKLRTFSIRYRNSDEDRDASQEEFQYDTRTPHHRWSAKTLCRLYRDQLALTERHLDGLLANATSALEELAVLSEAFKAVEAQTSAFQAQCEDLLADQKRLVELSEGVEDGLQYYNYLEPITRRLNAPGAGRLVGDEVFNEMLANLNSALRYMEDHVSSTLLHSCNHRSPRCPCPCPCPCPYSMFSPLCQFYSSLWLPRRTGIWHILQLATNTPTA